MAVKLNVLFLCTGNSCRSQMAEGWAHHLKGELISPYSAGTEPHDLDETAVSVMAEAGVDISHQYSKHVESLQGVDFAAVVTVCDQAHESCPFFGGDTPVVHVGFPDPPRLANGVARQGGDAEAQKDCYRTVRDQIRQFIEGLPDSLYR